MRSKSNVLLYNITAVVIGLVISGLLLLFMKSEPPGRVRPGPGENRHRSI